MKCPKCNGGGKFTIEHANLGRGYRRMPDTTEGCAFCDATGQVCDDGRSDLDCDTHCDVDDCERAKMRAAECAEQHRGEQMDRYIDECAVPRTYAKPLTIGE